MRQERREIVIAFFPSSPECFMYWTWSELILFPSSVVVKFFLLINFKSIWISSRIWNTDGFYSSRYIDLIRDEKICTKPSSQWVSINFTTWHMLICCDVKIPMADLFVICWLNFTTIFMIMTSIIFIQLRNASRAYFFSPRKFLVDEKKIQSRKMFFLIATASQVKRSGSQFSFTTTADTRENMNPFFMIGMFPQFFSYQRLQNLSFSRLNEILMQKEH